MSDGIYKLIVHVGLLLSFLVVTCSLSRKDLEINMLSYSKVELLGIDSSDYSLFFNSLISPVGGHMCFQKIDNRTVY